MSKRKKNKSEEIHENIIAAIEDVDAAELVEVVETPESIEGENLEPGANEEVASDEVVLADELGDTDEIPTAVVDEENPFDQLLRAAESEDAAIEDSEAAAHLAGTELDGYESAAIEDFEFIEEERLESIIEAMLFASDRPISLNTFKMTFKGTNVRGEHIRRTLDRLATEYAGGRRGVSLDEVPGGYQLRTKLDNMKFLTRNLKVRPFKLSGPALEVLAIVAYKQPVIKSELDDIRGVESGHLLRALMEKGLVQFEGKSDFPGRPMLYGTTKKFLEIFSLRNLKELPTISQIDELLPEGIGDDTEVQKPKLADVTEQMSQTIGSSYSEGEEELLKINETLQDIDISADFFEQEKLKQREMRDAEKASNLREAVMVGEAISSRDRSWLERFDLALSQGTTLAKIALEKEKSRLASVKKTSHAEASESVETPEADNKESVEESPTLAEETLHLIEAEGGEPSAEEVADAVEDAEMASIAGELEALTFESDEDSTESQSPRFEEEENISLEEDLNVPFHDEDDDKREPEASV